ncbi:hypothetical protein A3D62_03250 [Candidatus Kaiserbacteria bacterium RIFCSPHIGHO2_02_FULL_49_11]|uniref:GH18 domain-containing protein n=1 Tax=Candidatus Kaiserbacteria bacterium RIFCSPHIGHO2_02_FULL_49_11 TaxID=1798489 RepID=A0A1F6D1W4_9BACT|nr:MAG: hypothetical protein A3D62_03250 [Candidatus Kaiserbacteria bacterium RIFCSPHIGHO2_02_FULL_49_11]
MKKLFAFSFFFVLFLATPLLSSAAPIYAPFEVSGWIPYWRTELGTTDTAKHFGSVIEVNPFVYTLRSDGTLLDNGKINEEPWTSFVKSAKENRVRIIPTVMTSNSALVDSILRSPERRTAHIKVLVDTVYKNGFDGIDIDYEGKYASTRPYFSLFLKELYAAIGNRWVMCTIESRTPDKDRFNVIPPNIEFANDLKEINKYCDRVRVMAYDQQSIDLRLNDSTPGPYSPVADTRWVEKVINLMAKDISKKKLVIGVPTYGYEYEVTAYSNAFTYDLLWSFNPGYAIPIAESLGIAPTRNAAGEISFAYVPTTTPSAIPNSPHVPLIAQALAAGFNSNYTFRMMWWSDAQAIADKIKLAKKLGVRGVAIFKLDGGQDPNIWGILPKR